MAGILKPGDDKPHAEPMKWWVWPLFTIASIVAYFGIQLVMGAGIEMAQKRHIEPVHAAASEAAP